MNARSYLGDGVYVDLAVDEATVVLTTENGLRTTNEIWLEPEVFTQLEKWIARVREQKKELAR